MRSNSSNRRRKLLLSNQSTTYLFRSLCDRLAEDFPDDDVYLLAGSCELEAGQRPDFIYLKATELVRSPGWKRLMSWSVYTLRFLFVVLSKRWDLVLVTTNPPFCAWVMGLMASFMRRPYVVIEYDIYTDVLDRMTVLKSDSVAYRVLKKLSALSMRGASGVVTLGEDMARHLQAHGSIDATNLHIIPNWADTSIYRPVAREENAFAKQCGIGDRFVVMYSGAFGATHDVDSMLEAARALSDLPDLVFVLVGKGTRYREIEAKIQRLALANVKLLPWQPIEIVPLSLAAADCHIVTLDAPYAGISFPSKFYTSISVGAAILALAPPDTDMCKVVRDARIGRVVPPGQPEDMADALRDLYTYRGDTREMQERSRRLAEEQYDEKRCTGLYVELVKSILGKSEA